MQSTGGHAAVQPICPTTKGTFATSRTAVVAYFDVTSNDWREYTTRSVSGVSEEDWSFVMQGWVQFEVTGHEYSVKVAGLRGGPRLQAIKRNTFRQQV